MRNEHELNQPSRFSRMAHPTQHKKNIKRAVGIILNPAQAHCVLTVDSFDDSLDRGPHLQYGELTQSDDKCVNARRISLTVTFRPQRAHVATHDGL